MYQLKSKIQRIFVQAKPAACKTTVWLLVFNLALSAHSLASVPNTLFQAHRQLQKDTLKPCRYNNALQFTDPRDGKIYRQVQIGQQCWMAENLNVGEEVRDLQQSNNQVIEKTCYQNNPANCLLYGGLYVWQEAMDYASEKSPDAIAVNKDICPAGWHLPSDQEWKQLEKQIAPEMEVDATGWRGNSVAWELISKGETWTPPLGKDKFDLHILPAGNGVSAWFFYLKRGAYFWSSTSYSSVGAWHRSLSSDSGQVFRDSADKMLGFSIRCIKND